MSRLIARWRAWRRGPLVDEICRTCHEQLHARDCWETRHDFTDEHSIGIIEGGTYLTAYWCGEHRPADAVRTAQTSTGE